MQWTTCKKHCRLNKFQVGTHFIRHHGKSARGGPKNLLVAGFRKMLKRNIQLDSWVQALVLPTCTWFSGLFNPMAFLTAVMQVTGRRQGYPLDQMTTESHVSMITDIEKANSYPPDGAYVHGIFLEGARWGAYYDEDEADGDQDTYDIAGVPCGGICVTVNSKICCLCCQ